MFYFIAFDITWCHAYEQRGGGDIVKKRCVCVCVEGVGGGGGGGAGRGGGGGVRKP